jgi:hypothetical protein
VESDDDDVKDYRAILLSNGALISWYRSRDVEEVRSRDFILTSNSSTGILTNLQQLLSDFTTQWRPTGAAFRRAPSDSSPGIV